LQNKGAGSTSVTRSQEVAEAKVAAHLRQVR
jgi:hypothetical protein